MKEGGKPGIHGDGEPGGIGQRIELVLFIFRVFFAAHDYCARLVLRYDHGISWPPLPIKIIAVSLPLGWAFLWTAWASAHPEAGPEYRDCRAILACYYPLMGLAIYRTVWSWFSVEHGRYPGYPYICWVLGGDELKWRLREAFLVLAATYPAMRLGVPFASFVGSMGVGMLFQQCVSRIEHGRLRRGIRDGQAEGQMLMD